MITLEILLNDVLLNFKNFYSITFSCFLLDRIMENINMLIIKRAERDLQRK